MRTRTRRTKGYRNSILHRNRNDDEIDWEEREGFLRVPGEIALAGLLKVGKVGDMKGFDTERRKRLIAFNGVKNAYLSEGTFLDINELAEIYPEASDPNSSLQGVIKLSNLLAYLELIASSNSELPKIDSKESAKRLMEAAQGFLLFVVPKDHSIHNGILNILVGILVQAYIASLSNPRPISATAFFKKPLATYSKSPNSISNRAVSITFATYCNDIVEQISKFGPDAEVLKIKFKWENFWNEIRSYGEVLARDFTELGVVDSEEEGVVDVQPLRPVAQGRNGNRRRILEDSSETEEQSAEQVAEQLGTISPSKIKKRMIELGAGRQFAAQVLSDSEDEEHEGEEEEEVDQTITESFGTQRSLAIQEMLQLESESESESAKEEESNFSADGEVDLQKLAEMNQLLEQSGEESSDEDSAPQTQFSIDTQLPNRVAELLALENDDEEPSQSPRKQTIQFSKAGMLHLADPKPIKIGVLNDKSMGEKIQFDTQSQEPEELDALSQVSMAGSERFSRASKGKGKAVDKKVIIVVEETEEEEEEWEDHLQSVREVDTVELKSKNGGVEDDPEIESGRPFRGSSKDYQQKDMAPTSVVNGEGDDFEFVGNDAFGDQEFGGGEDLVYQKRKSSASPFLESDDKKKRSSSKRALRDGDNLPERIKNKSNGIDENRSPPVAGPSGYNSHTSPPKKKRRKEVIVPEQNDEEFLEESDNEEERLAMQSRVRIILPIPENRIAPSRSPPPIASNNRKVIIKKSSSPPIEVVPIARCVNVNRLDKVGREGGDRIPWSWEETETLISEMKLRSTNWQGIYNRHGQFGTISKRLKLRTNVGLKDKAVILKAEYMDRLRPVPIWLEKVTAKPHIRKRYVNRLAELRDRIEEEQEDDDEE